MQGPFVLHIDIKDANGELVQDFNNYKLDEFSLVGVQEAVSSALVAMGKAGLELKKSKAGKAE